MADAIESIIGGEWLPREDIDFVVGRTMEVLNGITVEIPDHRIRG